MSPSLQRRAPRTVLLACVAALAACGIPSEPPIFEQTWIVPADSITVTASDLVPAGITVTAGATPSFSVTTPTANFSTTLARICGHPVCQSPVSVTTNTPAFSSAPGLLAASVSFPTRVTSVTVAGGLVRFAITNNLGFDPLRPNGPNTAPYGTLTVTITGGASPQSYLITGSPTQGMPNGATTPLNFALATGVYLSTINVDLAPNVPTGGSATINGSNGLAVATSLQSLSVSQASFTVQAESINSAPSAFDLEGVDFADRVQGGALLLTTVNPFTATAAFSLVIQAPAQNGSGAVTISKAVAIPAQPTSTSSISFTRAEIRSLLGKSGVTMRVNGLMSGTGPLNSIILTPTSQLIVRMQLQLLLHVGA